MSKFIVKSSTDLFGGLFFRKALSHSIEWTSFTQAACHFDEENHALIAMVELGICNFKVEKAPDYKVFAPNNPASPSRPFTQ